MHQACAGQVLHRFEVLKGLVEVAPRDAGMLSRQCLRAHPFAMRNGVHDQDVLVGRNQEELPQFGEACCRFRKALGDANGREQACSMARRSIRLRARSRSVL